MIRIVTIALGVLLFGWAALYLSPDERRLRAHKRQIAEWQERCAPYLGKPAMTLEARACFQEKIALVDVEVKRGWRGR